MVYPYVMTCHLCSQFYKKERNKKGRKVYSQCTHRSIPGSCGKHVKHHSNTKNYFKAKMDANKNPVPSCNQSQNLSHSIGYCHWVIGLMILCFVKSDLLSEHGLICQYCAVH